MAINSFTEAIRRDPQDAYAYACRGAAYGRVGEYDKEIADCNEAVRLDPRFTVAYNNRGMAF